MSTLQDDKNLVADVANTWERKSEYLAQHLDKLTAKGVNLNSICAHRPEGREEGGCRLYGGR
jgi:hypothetical protein